MEKSCASRSTFGPLELLYLSCPHGFRRATIFVSLHYQAGPFVHATDSCLVQCAFQCASKGTATSTATRPMQCNTHTLDGVCIHRICYPRVHSQITHCLQGTVIYVVMQLNRTTVLRDCKWGLVVYLYFTVVRCLARRQRRNKRVTVEVHVYCSQRRRNCPHRGGRILGKRGETDGLPYGAALLCIACHCVVCTLQLQVHDCTLRSLHAWHVGLRQAAS